MKRIKIDQLKDKIGKEVLVEGWIHEIRTQSKIKFILLRDNSGIVQLIITQDTDKFVDVDKLSRESVLSVCGLVQKATVKSLEVTEKDLEIVITKFEVLSQADSNLPIQIVKGKDIADLSTRLDWRWLDLRKPQNFLIFKIWTHMEKAMRDFWIKHDFIQIHSPKLMSVPSESGAELFGTEYFGRTAYLAQSPQFYKQMAMAAGFEKIFEIGPVFRANPSHTTRHDTEFTSVDVEISFIESHEDVMKFEEEWLEYVLSELKKHFSEEVKEKFGVEIVVPTLPFPRITMTEAKQILKEKRNYTSTVEDLDPEGEKLMSELIFEQYKHNFVFVTEYPTSVRPFYHMRIDSNTTKSYDLIWNGIEITTGAQREHRPEILREQAIEKGLNLESIKDYLNFFKYGCPPHGGFGLSPTRLLIILLGLKNVREATFLPRDTDRLTP
jgi:nondiscriminating aspartyl-tRNA synthetase